MSWNEIVGHQENYHEKWEANIKGEDVLLRLQTRLVMKKAAEDPVKELKIDAK